MSISVDLVYQGWIRCAIDYS